MPNIAKIFLLVLTIAHCSICNAQKPYTTPKYQFDSIKNITYGIVSDYAGNNDTLIMDIYRPKNDSNCKRPVAVLIHGGAWIVGSKDDATLRYLADKLARRGWVVANIKYRLGTHKARNYDMYALCNNSVSQPCAYISDSAEIYRANFRAVQDTKGAIRFMKNRHVLDSSDVNQVYLIGFSAGAFIALQSAFTDSGTSISPLTRNMAAAPTPSSNISPYNCNPSTINFNRPNLGATEGFLHIGNYNSKVKGVASFYGGVLNPEILKVKTDTPSVYLFHQGSDVVVNYQRGILLGRISYECFAPTNLCQPYYFYPVAYGGESIRKFFADSGFVGNNFKADIVSNYVYNNNCFSNGHSVDNLDLRTNTMIDFFADRIIRDGNDAKNTCGNSGIITPHDPGIYIYPNPFGNELTIEFPEATGQTLSICDHTGKTVFAYKLNSAKETFQLNHLSSGIYFIRIEGILHTYIINRL